MSDYPWDTAEIGERVEILRGEHAGETARIFSIYSGTNGRLITFAVDGVDDDGKYRAHVPVSYCRPENRDTRIVRAMYLLSQARGLLEAEGCVVEIDIEDREDQ